MTDSSGASVQSPAAPTEAQPPSPPVAQAASVQAPPVQTAPPQATNVQAPPVQAPPVQPPPTQTTPAVPANSPAVSSTPPVGTSVTPSTAPTTVTPPPTPHFAPGGASQPMNHASMMGNVPGATTTQMPPLGGAPGTLIGSIVPTNQNANAAAPVSAEGRFRLPPGVTCPGSYVARAKSWDFRPTQGGDVMLCVIFEIKTGIDADGKSVWADFPRAKNLAFTDNSEARSYESLGYMGWKGDDLSELAENGGPIKEEVDVQIQMSSEWEDSKGVKHPPSPEIAWINPLNGIRGEKIDAPTLKDWAASMKERRKAKLAAAKPSEALKKVIHNSGGTAPGGFTPGADDDIPF